tara:strand:- start:844 stop:1611 length:768 start_codon:yes stop_codon:yes gene_type:complete
MNILIVIDETSFFHPIFLNKLIRKLKKKNHLKIALITKIKKSNSLERYLIKNIFNLKVKEIIKLSYKKLLAVLFKNVFYNFGKFFSVMDVIKKNRVQYMKIEYDINREDYFDEINEFFPDIIISSCSVIFGNQILNLPKYGCINRHSSLLPSYGGVYPVFHSIANGDEFSGVTIHEMTNEIDGGKILAQEKIYNVDKNLYKIYKVAFDISVELIISAIDNKINNKYIKNNFKKKYFSFPSKKDWINFRNNKGKFI